MQENSSTLWKNLTCRICNIHHRSWIGWCIPFKSDIFLLERTLHNHLYNHNITHRNTKVEVQQKTIGFRARGEGVSEWALLIIVTKIRTIELNLHWTLRNILRYRAIEIGRGCSRDIRNKRLRWYVVITQREGFPPTLFIAPLLSLHFAHISLLDVCFHRR